MLDILEIYSYNAIGKSKFLLTTSCACSILVYFSVCVRARVCVRVCVCVCPFTVKASSVDISWNTRE